MRVDDEDDGIVDMPDNSSAPAASVSSDEGRTAATAESSPATGEPERDTLSLVRDVVEKANASSVAASPAEGQGAGTLPSADDPKKEPGPEDFDGLPFSRHPRFQKLISERKDLLKEVDRLKGSETDAERFRNIDTFLRSHEVSNEDAALALTVVARSQRDPVGALESLRPFLQNLMTRAGVILPQDLQQAVTEGRYTPDAAAELSRARAMQLTYQRRDEVEAQRELERRQSDHVASLVNTATTWEGERKAKDPNYAAKADSITERVAFLQRIDGIPGTPDGVRAQLEKAYAHVNARALTAAPAARRVPVRPVTGGQVATIAPTSAAPKSTMDIIRQQVSVRG